MDVLGYMTSEKVIIGSWLLVGETRQATLCKTPCYLSNSITVSTPSETSGAARPQGPWWHLARSLLLSLDRSGDISVSWWWQPQACVFPEVGLWSHTLVNKEPQCGVALSMDAGWLCPGTPGHRSVGWAGSASTTSGRGGVGWAGGLCLPIVCNYNASVKYGKSKREKRWIILNSV